MHKTKPDDLIALQRNLILLLLLALTTTSWAALVWQQSDAHLGMTMVWPIMGLRALLSLAIWVIMMVAMMLPTTAPMILTFHSVQAGHRPLDDAYFASTWVFVGAYLSVWALAGIAAFAGVLVAEIAAKRAALPPATAAQVGGAIFLVAGIYQLTPLKEICLSKCRTSTDFTMSWRRRDGGRTSYGLALWSLIVWAAAGCFSSLSFHSA